MSLSISQGSEPQNRLWLNIFGSHPIQLPHNAIHLFSAKLSVQKHAGQQRDLTAPNSDITQIHEWMCQCGGCDWIHFHNWGGGFLSHDLTKAFQKITRRHQISARIPLTKRMQYDQTLMHLWCLKVRVDSHFDEGATRMRSGPPAFPWSSGGGETKKNRD